MGGAAQGGPGSSSTLVVRGLTRQLGDRVRQVALLDEAVDGPGGFHLGGVTVDPPLRRQGAGTALTVHRLAWVWKRADVAWCVVNGRNSASLLMHERVGFIEVERRSRIHGIEFDGGVGILLRAERP